MFCLRAPANQRFGYTEIDRNFQQSHTESIEACTLARACFHLRVVAQKNRYGYVTPGHTKNIALGITCTTNTSVSHGTPQREGSIRCTQQGVNACLRHSFVCPAAACNPNHGRDARLTGAAEPT